MSFSVLNNVASLQAQNELATSQVGLQKTLFRLSSGRRINSGADDAAGLAIADGLRGQIRALDQATRNANDGIGYLQTADGALGQITNLLHRAVSLAEEASTSTNTGNADKIDAEYTQIKDEITRISGNTYFNGTDVFSTNLSIFVGDTTSTSTIGLNLSSMSVSAGGLSLTNNLLSPSDSSTALGQINSALQAIAGYRGDVGAQVNRLQSASAVIGTQVQNLTAAESQIRDANMAEEVTNMTKFQILQQAGMSAMAQANASAQSVLSLFR